MKDLSIRVAFSGIDKLTRPTEAARKSVGGLTDSLKKNQSSIQHIDKQSHAFTRLKDRVNTTSQRLDNARRAFTGLNKAQKDGATLTEAQRTRMAALAAKIDRLSASRSADINKLRQSAQALRAHGVSLAGGDRTMQSAIRRTEQYSQSMERQRRQLAAVTQAQASYNRLNATAQKLRNSGAMTVAGTAAAGYAAGRFLAPAVGFDEEMSRVGALTRLDKNSDHYAALRAQAKKLGSETAFSTRDAASGQAFLAMAGFTPESIQAALPGVLNMALAGGMELGETADIGSNVLTQFRLSSDQMDRVGDTLTAAFTRSNTDLRALGDTMKYAGPVAANLGISLEQAAAMAGMLANNGLRGSDAGTAMRGSLSRLASPPKAAAAALKELGVSVADASGKMRPMENVLADLYRATKKYGETDQVSFFKDIAGEQAFVGLQTLVQSAGSGELQKLTQELQAAQGESASVASKMADNLGGDLKTLSSVWEAFRIQVEELADDALRRLTQSLSSVINGLTRWSQDNPVLSQTLLVAAGSALAFGAAIGGTSLAVGLLMGPLAKLRLGFALLSGSGATGIGIVTQALSGLSVALSLPLGLIGAIGVAFIAAGVLIWKYWEPIKAFFTGFFAGVMDALTPFRDALACLGPLFGVITTAVSRLWQWFCDLLSPMQTSKETLDKCASAGEAFGKVFGFALQALMLPLTGLMKMITWILEKLDLIPEGIDAAKAKADKMQGELTPAGLALLQDKVGALTGDASAISKPTEKPASPVITSDSGTLRRLQKIADNTGGILDETKKQRIGPGDIVFKNLPRALAVQGAWQASHSAVGAMASLGNRPAIAAASAPIQQPVAVQPVSRPASSTHRPQQNGASPSLEIHIHMHLQGDMRSDSRELARAAAAAVETEFQRRFRSGGSFRDQD